MSTSSVHFEHSEEASRNAFVNSYESGWSLCLTSPSMSLIPSGTSFPSIENRLRLGFPSSGTSVTSPEGWTLFQGVYLQRWSALLGSFFGAKVVGQDGVSGVEEYDSPFLRMNRPHGPAVKDGDGTNSASSPAYLGYRVLSKEEIRVLATEIVKQVRADIGPHASPQKIQFTPGLPKTRSGKIMRRILRKIAEGDTGNLGDTSTLADPAVVDSLVAGRVE